MKDGVVMYLANHPQNALHASSLQNIYADREMTNHNFNSQQRVPVRWVDQ
jgi:hypothetical protein